MYHITIYITLALKAIKLLFSKSKHEKPGGNISESFSIKLFGSDALTVAVNNLLC